jgi:hypothetical protein
LHAAPGAGKTLFTESRLGSTGLRSLDVNSLFDRFRKPQAERIQRRLHACRRWRPPVLTCSQRRPSSGWIDRRG